MAVVYQKIRDDIRDSGLSIIAVGPSDEHPPFSYSVGLSGPFKAEVLLEGIPQDLSMYLINTIAKAAKNAGIGLEPGIYLGLIQGQMPVALIEADPAWRDKRSIMVNNILGHDYRLLQMLLPDKNGCFPWEEGYDVSMGKQTVRRADGNTTTFVDACKTLPVIDLHKALGQLKH